MYLEGIAHPWKGQLTERSHADYPLRLHPAAETFEARLSPEPSAAPSPAVDTRYLIQKGDNLSRIVRQHLESLGEKPSNQAVYDGVRKVAKENGISNPDVIHPGQQLDLRTLGAPVAAPTPQLAAIPKPAQPEMEKVVPAPLEAKAEAPAPPPGFQEARVAALPQHAAPVALEARAEGGPVHRIATPLHGRARFEGPVKAGVEREDLGLLIHEILEAPKVNVAKAVPGPLESPWSTFIDGPARLTSGYGLRPDPFTGRLSFHDGIDLAAPMGTAIYPFREGVVSFSGWKGGYGRVVIVEHDEGISSLYAHNARNKVEVGQRIGTGDKLGEIGSTGRSTGPHLHFEIRKNGVPVNPIPYLQGDVPIRNARR